MNTTNERQSNFKTKFFNLVKSLLGACIALIVMRPSVIVCAAPTLSDLQIVDQSITRTGNATEKGIKVQGEYIGDGMEVELVSVKSWPKIEGITKYAVQISTRKRVNYKTIAYTKKSKRKIRVSGKMRYVKILAFVRNKRKE